MKTILLAGGIICPAIPSFYSKPATLEQAVETVIERILNLAGFDIDSFKWGEAPLNSFEEERS
jgi:4-hydroxy-3-polyprenylbenzoate decarboxylase